MLKENGVNADVAEAGLKLSASSPYLVALPDGIVKYHDETWGLEMKCPFSKFSSSF